MIDFNVNVKIDENKIGKRIDRAIDKAQFALDNQILKDSNYFIPFDRGDLLDSSITHSEIGQGQLVWLTPYARRLYYNPQYNFSTDRNPNAGGLWFERAKSLHSDEWIELVQKKVDENV